MAVMCGMIKWIIAIVVVVAGVIFLVAYNNNNPSLSPTTTATATASPTPSESATPSASASATPSASKTPTPTPAKKVTVTYTDSCYSPKSVTVPVGGVVTFVNNSTHQMWTASAAHPTHTVYSGTSLSQHCPDTTNMSFDECQSDGQ